MTTNAVANTPGSLIEMGPPLPGVNAPYVPRYPAAGISPPLPPPSPRIAIQIVPSPRALTPGGSSAVSSNSPDNRDPTLVWFWQQGMRDALLTAAHLGDEESNVSDEVNLPDEGASAQAIRQWLASNTALILKVKKLSLVLNKSYLEFPPEMVKFINVTLLKIAGGEYKALPNFQFLTKLDTLDLQETHVEQLPPLKVKNIHVAKCKQLTLIDGGLMKSRTWFGTPFLLVQPELLKYLGSPLSALLYGCSSLYSMCKEPPHARVGSFSLGGINGIDGVRFFKLDRKTLSPSLAFLQKWSIRTLTSRLSSSGAKQPSCARTAIKSLAWFFALFIDFIPFLWNFFIAFIAMIWGISERSAYFKGQAQVHPVNNVYSDSSSYASSRR